MSASNSRRDPILPLVAVAAVVAHHVAILATRDALFLSHFDVTWFPRLLGISLFAAVAIFLPLGRALARRGFGPLLPGALIVSAALYLVDWALLPRAPRLVTVVVYVQGDVIAAIVYSAFVALMEALPWRRRARPGFDRANLCALLGVLVGGGLTFLAATRGTPASMLPVVAVLQLIGGFAARRWCSAAAAPATQPVLLRRQESVAEAEARGLRATLRLALRAPYSRDLGAVVLLGAMCAVPLDYALKQRAAAHFAAGEELFRFFALFYCLSGMLMHVWLPLFARAALDRAGLAGTVSIWPLTVVAGGLGALVVPGLGSVMAGRGAELVTRRALFRPAYELMYTPVAPAVRHAVKPFVDLWGERVGEALGGAAVALLLLLVPGGGLRALAVLAITLAALALLATRHLHAGYVRALEDALARHVVQLDENAAQDRTTRVTLAGLRQVDLSRSWRDSSIAIPVAELQRLLAEQEAAGLGPKAIAVGDPEPRFVADSAAPASTTGALASPARDSAVASPARDAAVASPARDAAASPARGSAGDGTSPAEAATNEAAEAAAEAAALRRTLPTAATLPRVPAAAPSAMTAQLRSGDANTVRRALGAASLERGDVTHVLPLLARDDLAGDAIAALRRIVPDVTGLLVDVLLDPQEPLAVRRRLPRVLAVDASPRVIDGLLRGLEDSRSEIRQQSGRALARLHSEHPELVFERDRVMRLVRQEAGRGKQVWEGQQQLDHDDNEESPLMDEVLRDRANRSLEHVFVLLSLALPLEPLRVAFAGLHTEDEALRGTALDYLESVLPPDVRGSLWPLLADRSPRTPRQAPGHDALQDLLGSNQSIQINLAELRRRLQEGS